MIQQAAVELLALEGSDTWAAEREAAIEAANRARSEAKREAIKEQPRNEDGTFGEPDRVDPQDEGQLGNDETTPKPKRDHAKKHAQSAATLAAQRIGVSRATVERVTAIKRAG